MPRAAPARSRPASASSAQIRTSEPASLTLSSRNYSSWSLRGWLLVRMSGVPVQEVMVAPDDSGARRELLLLAPSIRVPCLTHQGIKVWDTLAIAEYLHELHPEAGLLPEDTAARAHCRSICGEMHSGFASLRSALPMNLKGSYPGFKVWARAQEDIDRVLEIWTECLTQYGGPWLFGERRSMADAMYAPVVTRLATYQVPVSQPCRNYMDTVLSMPEMIEWAQAAQSEPDEIEELDMEF
jgi:glutathione S-transferase